MLRSIIAILGLIPAFALGILSCAADPTTEEGIIAEDEATLVAADRDMYGTYRAFVIGPGAMPLLVLKTDGTYHRVITMPCPTAGPCVPAQDDGQFAIRRASRASYLYLYSDTGGVGTYQYVYLGDTLRLRLLDQKGFVSMTKTPDASWCGEVDDCAVQNLQAPSCHGLWLCGASACSYACMTGPVEEPKPVEDPDPTGETGF